ncbi:MAG TPA: DUF2167 domain-containing protein [Dongiaceae bacterium]|nr:DUF2167 domain-containing protein [Dongiaceae bacterium]
MKSRWLLPLLAVGVLSAAGPLSVSAWAEPAQEAAAMGTENVETEAAESEAADLTEKEKEYMVWATQFVASLHRQTGEIQLPDGVAKLTVPEDFYYLSPEDAERVLTEAWGNPGGQPTLGMLFPASVTPLDQGAWGVTIEYSEDGYVSDEDAHELNYADLLKDMQEDTSASNEDRAAAGFEAIELIGWAAQPYYDSTSHKLHWAQELKFGEAEENTLNYNIRVLGRKGYLLMNFVADMGQLREIEQNLDKVLAMAEFNDGYRYDQFDPEYDKMAAYGIGGLVAGKVLAKTGFLALALVFLKKFGVVILGGAVALGARLFKRKKAG